MTKAREFPNARETRMATMYRDGMTLVQIGAEYGITRERVRQLLLKWFGIRKGDGGSAMRRFKRTPDLVLAAKQHNEAREVRCRAKWGMSREQYLSHIEQWGSTSNPRSPMYCYLGQRKNAARRRIEWQFNFAQWWDFWTASGHWSGRGRGGYCMARHGDSGPYSPENVYICTVAQNFSDSWLIDHPRRRKGGRGYSLTTYPVRGGTRFMVTFNEPINGKLRYGAITSRSAAEAFARESLGVHRAPTVFAGYRKVAETSVSEAA